ncbi:MAG: hypothetical protein QOC77_2858 [Thermoleophilaceae bacterium]|jgi:hypothetical protein|nr:hypothetical protein [Solirubrobacteraceae bacterium]MEA2412297.1 hypothetical protein [Thermoleophilaceae bacterium]
MDDSSIQDRIEKLVSEEHRLQSEAEGAGPNPERHERLQELKVELDRCWDLLRQRRAHEEFGQDPDEAEARDARVVEDYLQ